MQVRIQKVIAGSGVASRREAELLIRQGRVTVNGTVIYKLGTCVDPEVDHIKVNGEHVGSTEPEVFILMHKPAGYLTTMKDPFGRPTVADLMDRIRLRVFPVGRLDFDAEGLLLLTNNGQVAQACLHPKYHVPKTYVLKVSKVLSEGELTHLRQGVQLDDGVTLPAIVKKSGKAHVNSWIEMTIFEGRTHQVKRMLEALGHRVLRLKRIRFGPVGLGNLLPGTTRFATDAEANALRGILKRPPRLEKSTATMVRAPGGPLPRVDVPPKGGSTQRPGVPRPKLGTPSSGLSHLTGSGNMKAGRRSIPTRNNPDPKKKPIPVGPMAKGKQGRPEKGGPTRPPSRSGQPSRQGLLDRPKTKRPTFPMRVAPKVVLKAFMDHEKQILEERALRPSPHFTEKSHTRLAPGSRGNKAKSRLPRNGSGPRPGTPKPGSRSTVQPRSFGTRSFKKRRG